MGKLNHTAAAVLGHLQREPMTGWQIARTVEVSLCDFFNVTRSQIYKELRSLAEAGLVEPGAVGSREKRPYAITTAGHEAFRSWLQEDPSPDIMRSPFYLKLSFADHLDQETMQRFIDQHRQRNEAQLMYYRDLQPTVEAISPSAAHVLRAGIAHREATLQWLDSLRSAGKRHRTPAAGADRTRKAAKETGS